MKKTTAIAMALVLSLMLGTVSFAEAPTETTIPAEVTQPAVTQDGTAFLSWISQGMDIVTDTITEGFDTVTDTVESGWNQLTDTAESGLDWLREKMNGWTEKAEAFLAEHSWDDQVRNAWNTLKTGANEKGKIAQEKLDEAYRTVKTWMIARGEELNQEATAAVDGIAAAAGVVEAQVSSYYRTVESFITTHAEQATDAVMDAWLIIKRSTTDAAAASKAELSKAFDTLHEWLLKSDEGDSPVEQALEGIENYQQN